MAKDPPEQNTWLEELRAKYDGPPPIPVEAAEEMVRRDLGVDVTARHTDYIYQEDGETRLTPTTIVEFPDGRSFQFFPKSPPQTHDPRTRK